MLASMAQDSHSDRVKQTAAPSPLELTALGWSKVYEEQLASDEAELFKMRVSHVHRSRITATSQDGPVQIELPAHSSTTDFAVGDWILVEPETHIYVRTLERQTLLQRRSEGFRGQQLIAANVDTLFIVTSCNDDFNIARLERYLALANEAGTQPVIVLTKADQASDFAAYATRAKALQRGLEAVTLDATDKTAADVLAKWCGPGQTVALVGSSGVGKSTLLNTLTGKTGEDAQLTGGIREDDAKGRHTTTSRSLHAIEGGGLVIDTPGMRTLHVSDIASGIDALFAEITELAPACKFRDCTHEHEPGCKIQDAIKAGTLDPARLDRWRKLVEENDKNTPVLTGPRGNKVAAKRGKRR